MAKSWRETRKQTVAGELLNAANIEAHKSRLVAEVRAHRLAELRRACGLNQESMAERLQISQSRVSRIERGQLEQAQVATLKAYVEALGGELEVSARFGDERITISGS